MVFTSVYRTVESNNSTTNTTDITSNAKVTDSSYEDDNIKMTLTEYYEYDTKIYVAEVVLKSSEYLKTAFANNAYGKNVTAKTSEIAANNNAILAINGDYYGVRENGYVLRNGVIYRSTPSKNQED